MQRHHFSDEELFGLEHPDRYDAERTQRIAERNKHLSFATRFAIAGCSLQTGCWAGVGPMAEKGSYLGFLLFAALGIAGAWALAVAFEARGKARYVVIPSPRVPIEVAIERQRRNLEAIRAELSGTMTLALRRYVESASRDAVRSQYDITSRLGNSLASMKVEVQQLADEVDTIVREALAFDDGVWPGGCGGWDLARERTVRALSSIMGERGYHPSPLPFDKTVDSALSHYRREHERLLELERWRGSGLALDLWRTA